MSAGVITTDPCPLCAGRRGIPIAVGTRHGIPAPTVMCRDCGMVFQNPIPTEAALDEFYRERYREMYSGSSTPDDDFLAEQRERGRVILRRVGARLSPGNSVLDIGCGPGAALEPFRDAGFRVAGLEPGPYGEWGARNLGLDVKTAGIDALVSETERYDLVVLSFVLEHLRDPVDALASVARVLAPGGFVHIEVPDLLGNHGRLSDYVHLAHISYFTPTTVMAAVMRAGMRPGPVDAAGRYSLWVDATPTDHDTADVPVEDVDARLVQLRRHERRARVEHAARSAAKPVLRAAGRVTRRFGGSARGPEDMARRAWRSLRGR